MVISNTDVQVEPRENEACQLPKHRRQLQDLLTEKNCENVLANKKKALEAEQ